MNHSNHFVVLYKAGMAASHCVCACGWECKNKSKGALYAFAEYRHHQAWVERRAAEGAGE